MPITNQNAQTMKLYATVSSERATKGQGGNEYLLIVVGDGDRNKVLEINYRKGKINLHWYKPELKGKETSEKGKKQKTECEKYGCNANGHKCVPF